MVAMEALRLDSRAEQKEAMAALGRYVKQRRTALRMTQRELADLLELEAEQAGQCVSQRGQHWLSRLENGYITTMIAPSDIEALAKALDTTRRTLFEVMGYLDDDDALPVPSDVAGYFTRLVGDVTDMPIPDALKEDITQTILWAKRRMERGES